MHCVTYVVGDLIHRYNPVDSDNELRISVELKHQEMRAIKDIRSVQMEQTVKQDGYYLCNGVVYKVFAANTLVKKITGDEAKGIKRLIAKTYKV